MGFLVSQVEGGNHDLALADGGVLPVFIGPALGPSGLNLARVISPNGPLSSFTLQPTTVGKLLAVIDITPKQTGLLLVSANFQIVADGVDFPQIAMLWEENLTAVTGGTLLAPGLTDGNLGTLATTPDVVSGGTEVYSAAAPTAVFGASNYVNIAFAGIPFELTAGVRAAVGFFGISTGSETGWTVSLTASAVEQVMV